jgi:hypothetical protein
MDNYLDQFRYANKELKETRRELSYQQVFAQAAFELYDEQTQVSHSIMVLKGIHVDLLSELLRYERDKQAPAARERVELLAKHIDIIAKVQTDNYALNWNAGKMRQEIWEQKQEIADLKHRLYLTTLNGNELPENR